MTSRIILKAVLKTSLASVGARMLCYPALKQITGNAGLRYLIAPEKIKDRFYVLDLKRTEIIITLNALSSPSYLLRELTLYTVSICMTLSEDYDMDLKGLLPYLCAMLSTHDITGNETKRPNLNRESDILLSRRIVELKNQNNELTKRCEQLNASLISILSNFMAYKYRQITDVNSISKELGIETNLILMALEQLRSQGYKILNGRGGTLEIVRI